MRYEGSGASSSIAEYTVLLVMLGGAFFAIGYVVYSVDGGLPEFFRIAMADDKMKTFDWSFNLTQATVWIRARRGPRGT